MSMLEKSFLGPQSYSRNFTPIPCIAWIFIPRKNLVIENDLLTQKTCMYYPTYAYIGRNWSYCFIPNLSTVFPYIVSAETILF